MEHPATQSSGTTAVPHSHPQGPDFAEALAKGYEPKDIGLRPVFMFIAGLSVVLVVVLLAIYAIMMAMAAYDRSSDAVPSPVAVKIPAPYAPLQPSLGIYGNHDNDHDLLDWQDMDAMRYKATEALTSDKVVMESGRHHIPINAAIDLVIAKNYLVTKPVVEPMAAVVSYPPGSYEGVFNQDRPAKPDPDLNPNNLQRLNNLGN